MRISEEEADWYIGFLLFCSGGLAWLPFNARVPDTRHLNLKNRLHKLFPFLDSNLSIFKEQLY